MIMLPRFGHLACALLAFYCGYSNGGPSRIVLFNGDWWLSVPVFVLSAVAPIALVATIVRRTGAPRLRKPSWDRFTTHLLRDPLQSSAMSSIYTSFVALGVLVRAPSSGAKALVLAAVLFALAFGMLIGLLCSIKIYHRDIVD